VGEQALGVSLQDLAIPLKMGSSLVVKLSQIRIFKRFRAFFARFFYSFAEQNPDVFRGRKGVWGSRRLRLLGF